MFAASDQMMLQCPPRPFPGDRRWKSNVELAPNCPRCASSNTKFCYYNNYSLSQPRYFCKGCRRYWTKGGSLRDVPVGGGCRKNRRAAKAIRVSKSEPAFGNYDKNVQIRNNYSPDAQSMAEPSSGNGSDIDLAVVFAKFLNENSSLEPEFAGQELTGGDSVSNPDSKQPNVTIECQTPSDLIGNSSDLPEGLPQVIVGEKERDERNQEFIENGMNAYGLQTSLGDETMQDILWHDAAGFSNFSWQQMGQFQEFDSFPTDEQSKISSNFISDNWCSFDLSGF